MDLRQGSKTSLLLQLATQYGITVGDVTKWQFSPPTALSGDASGLNTKIKLTALTGNTGHTQFRSFKYNRTDLAEFKRNYTQAQSLSLTGVTRVYDCLAWILKATGVLLSTADVQDADVTDNGDGTFTIPLTASPTGIFWIGSCQITTGKLPSISKAINPAYFDWS